MGKTPLHPALYRPAEILKAEDLLAPPPFFPGEDLEAYDALRAALERELAPRSDYQRLLMLRIVEAEWTVQRRLFAISAIILDTAQTEARRRLLLQGLTAEEAGRIATDWAAFGRNAARRVGAQAGPTGADACLAPFGLQSLTLLAEARDLRRDLINQLEAENRRARQDIRLLKSDILALKRESPKVTEAEVVYDG